MGWIKGMGKGQWVKGMESALWYLSLAWAHEVCERPGLGCRNPVVGVPPLRLWDKSDKWDSRLSLRFDSGLFRNSAVGHVVRFACEHAAASLKEFDVPDEVF
jgi:hypothetical protein